MKKTSKKIVILATLGIVNFALSQTGKVGIETNQPTETLDVNGTTRIRTLPQDGDVNAIYTLPDGNASNNKDQKYTSENFVVADENGVIGIAKKKVVTVNSSDDDYNNASSLFVIKKYILKDNPSIRNGGAGFDTGMSTDKWEAIISLPFMKYNANGTQNPFTYNGGGSREWGANLVKGTDNIWKVKGNIVNIHEEMYIEILFINKDFVSASPERILDTQP